MQLGVFFFNGDGSMLPEDVVLKDQHDGKKVAKTSIMLASS